MVIEAKKTVNTNFAFIEAHDVLELMVYCQYLMRLHDLAIILGSLRDAYNEIQDTRRHANSDKVHQHHSEGRHTSYWIYSKCFDLINFCCSP